MTRRDVTASPPRDPLTLRSCDLALGWARLHGEMAEPRAALRTEALRAGLALACAATVCVVLALVAGCTPAPTIGKGTLPPTIICDGQ